MLLLLSGGTVQCFLLCFLLPPPPLTVPPFLFFSHPLSAFISFSEHLACSCFPSFWALTSCIILRRFWHDIKLQLQGNSMMWFLGEISQIWNMPFLLEEAGICHADPNNHIFNFETGYMVPPLSHWGISSWDERIPPTPLKPRRMLIHWQNEVWILQWQV